MFVILNSAEYGNSSFHVNEEEWDRGVCLIPPPLLLRLDFPPASRQKRYVDIYPDSPTFPPPTPHTHPHNTNNSCKTLIGVHEMHIVLVHDSLSSSAYPKITQTNLAACNLSIKTLVARQWPTISCSCETMTAVTAST